MYSNVQMFLKLVVLHNMQTVSFSIRSCSSHLGLFVPERNLVVYLNIYIYIYICIYILLVLVFLLLQLIGGY